MRKKNLLLLAFSLLLPIISSCTHEHEFSQWKEIEPATCIKEGKQERVCECGEKETQTINKVGHKEVIDAGKAPSCLTGGLTEGKHCSVCGEVIQSQEKIEALGQHTFSEWTVVKQSSCDENGVEQRTCECGEIESRFIAKLNHEEVIDAAVSPTCTTTGLTEGKHCSTCDKVLQEQSVIPELGHFYDINEWQYIGDDGHAHICDVCGKLETVAHVSNGSASEFESELCVDCGYVINDATGHITHSAATTWSNDESKHWHYCKDCESIKYDVSEHNFAEYVLDKQATNEEEGLKHSNCLVCDYESTLKILKTPTLSSQGVNILWEKIDNATGYYLYNKGIKVLDLGNVTEFALNSVSLFDTNISIQAYTDNISYCELSNLSNEVNINLDDFNLQKNIGTDFEGYDYNTQSSLFAQTGNLSTGWKKSTSDIGVFGIQSGYQAVKLFKEADGNVALKMYGGKEVIRAGLDINDDMAIHGTYKVAIKVKLGPAADNVGNILIRFHDKTGMTANDALVSTGYTFYNPDSGVTLSKDEWVTLETEITVNKKVNYTTDLCFMLMVYTNGNLTSGTDTHAQNYVLVDDLVVYKMIDKPHTEVIDKAVDPTCEYEGLTQGSHCADCNEVIIAQEAIPSKGHKEVIDEALAPSCTTTGLTQGSHCSECNKVLIAQEIVETVEHSGGKATCTEKAECEVCHEQYGTLVDHQYGELIEGTVKSCEDSGVLSHYQCSECNKYFTKLKEETTLENLTVNASSHQYGTLNPKQEATCESDGINAYYHCSQCNMYFTEEKVATTLETLIIRSLGHTYDENEWQYKEENGHGHICSVCDSEFIEDHKLGDYIVENQATTTQEGSVISTCSICDYQNRLIVLKTPIVSRNVDVLSWQAVDNATGYYLYNNGNKILDLGNVLEYKVLLVAGSYSYSIEAYTNNKEYYQVSLKSDIISFDITSLQDGLGTDFEGYSLETHASLFDESGTVSATNSGTWYEDNNGKKVIGIQSGYKVRLVDENGNKVLKIGGKNSNKLIRVGLNMSGDVSEAGTYVAKIKIKRGENADIPRLFFKINQYPNTDSNHPLSHYGTDNSSVTGIYFKNNEDPALSTEWTEYSVTFTVAEGSSVDKSTASNFCAAFVMYMADTNSSGNHYIFIDDFNIYKVS